MFKVLALAALGLVAIVAGGVAGALVALRDLAEWEEVDK